MWAQTNAGVSSRMNTHFRYSFVTLSSICNRQKHLQETLSPIDIRTKIDFDGFAEYEFELSYVVKGAWPAPT